MIALADYPFQTYGRNAVGGVKFNYTVSSLGGNSVRKYRGISSDGYGNEMIVEGREKSMHMWVNQSFRLYFYGGGRVHPILQFYWVNRLRSGQKKVSTQCDRMEQVIENNQLS